MKTCSKCGENKPEHEYYARGRGLTARCKECVKEGVRLYISKNKESRYAQQREYRIKNPNKIKARNRAAYLANPEKYAEQRDKRRCTHPFHSWFFSSRHVKLRNGHDFQITWEQMKAVLDDQSYSCALTGMPFFSSEKTPGVVGWDSPSIDRLDFSKGYTADNIRVVLFCVNSFRGRMTDTQMYDVAKKLIDNRE